jgi:hypothetical protein
MASKRSSKDPKSGNEELEWLRESHADALDYVDRLIDENADIRRENARLTEEVERLQRENANLRRAPLPQIEPREQLSPPPKTAAAQRVGGPPVESVAAVVQRSSLSPAERIAIFRRLFHGREDVYAKRWESQQKGTAGYSPACAMEWRRPHCTKPQKKCMECVYSPMMDEVLISHLAGHQTIGVYPMLPDDTCWFLAVTAPGRKWAAEVPSFPEPTKN